MKNILAFAVMALFALGACEEIVEIEKIVRDTVTIEKFTDRYFQGTDTVTITQIIEVPTPVRQEDSIVYVNQIDTVYLERVDSVFITTTILDTDTVVVHTYSYGDTLHVYLFDRVAMNFPMHLQPYWSWFFEQCDARGLAYQGPGPVYLTTGDLDDVQQGFSVYIFGQFLISINDNQTESEQFLPLMRELARNYLGKQYSQSPESLLFPFFSSSRIRWDNKHLFEEELNELFL